MSEMRGHKALRGVRPLLCDVTAPHLCDALAQNGIIREFRKGEMRGRKVQCGVNPLLYDVTLTLLCVVPPPVIVIANPAQQGVAISFFHFWHCHSECSEESRLASRMVPIQT